jgi:hypothetical protein
VIPNWADLIVVDVDAIDMATRFPAESVKEELRTIGLYISGGMLSKVWEEASFQGTGFRVEAVDAIGVSMDVAPLAGIGFSIPAWPSHLSASDLAMVKEKRQALQLIAKSTAGRTSLPIAAVTDFISDTEYPFEIAFRRRIAYALGYRALLSTRDAASFESLYDDLIRGTAEVIESLVRGRDEISKFSIALNLLARLEGTMSHERDHGQPPHTIRDYHKKVIALEERLKLLIASMRSEFNEDGRAALHGVLRELDSQRSSGIWNVKGTFPLWGGMANSEVFRHSE